MDYTNSKVIALNTGVAKLQSGTFKIIHTIDLNDYETLVTHLEDNLYSTFNTSHSIIPYLSFTISQIKSTIFRLKPRIKPKRSIEFLGSAWKWLAGSPDHHDFEILQNKMNNVLRNNNNQVIINKLNFDQINTLTNVTNAILKMVKTNTMDNERKISELKYKLDIVKEEISNIELAIHLAKVNIINSFILSNVELETLKLIFDKENIPFSSIDEILHFAKVKIATEGNSIIYIVSIPTTGQEICNNVLLKPIKNGNVIDKIKYEYILNCKKKIFGLINQCENYNSLTICTHDKYLDISNSTCIPRLLSSLPASCTTTNNDHVPEIEEIEEDILFLNQYMGSITIDNSSVWLNGTYIIHHCNSTIEINNKTYSAIKITETKPLPALVQPSKKSKYEETLSLKMMKTENNNNSNVIDELRLKDDIGLSLNFILLIFIILYAIAAMIKRYKLNHSTTLKTNSDAVQVEDHQNPQIPDRPPIRKGTNILHNLPFF